MNSTGTIRALLSVSGLNGWIGGADAGSRSGGEATRLINQVSFEINKGQTVALVGESGSGKSITALSILRLLEEHTPIRTSGSVFFDSEDLMRLPIELVRRIRGNRIAMIFQEPMTSLNPLYTIGNQIGESLRLHRNLSRGQIVDETIGLLERTGIDEPAQRIRAYPHELSGGQRQRVMIAMALACRPALLIADEPTTALDVSIQAKILSLIEDIKLEFHMAMLLITHDLALVRHVAEHICIMKDGAIIERGSPAKIFESPESDYTVRLIEASAPKRMRPQSDGAPLLDTDRLTCSFAAKSGLLQNLFGKRSAPFLAVDGVSLAIRQGTTTGIIGESGSGKTTLALAILRLLKSSGAIMFNNRRLDALSMKEMKRMRERMQIVFQDPYSSLSPRMTVSEIVSEGLLVHRRNLNKTEREQLVRRTLEEVGLDPGSTQRYPHEFSGGQRQRIAIARVLVLRPELLILDEPTSALDMTIQSQIIELLNRLQKDHRLTYLFISHDLTVIRAVADQLVVMQNGRVVEHGPAETIFTNPAHPYTRELFRAAYRDRDYRGDV